MYPFFIASERWKNHSVFVVIVAFHTWKNAFQCLLTSIDLAPNFFAFETFPTTLKVSRRPFQIHLMLPSNYLRAQNRSLFSNAFNSLSSNFFGCLEQCLSSKSKFLHLNRSTHKKSVKHDLHVLRIANKYFQLPISSNENKNVTLPANCLSLAQNFAVNKFVFYTSTKCNILILKAY